jgi:hypothetical protein
MSGSEVEVWNNRDTSSGGYKRNHERERAATAKGDIAMRAAMGKRKMKARINKKNKNSDASYGR